MCPVRHLFHKDFYPLTPPSHASDVWVAYQNHDPLNNEGMVLAFRRQSCTAGKVALRLWGLEPAREYAVTFEDAGRTDVFSGSELAEGLEIESKESPAAILVIYQPHQTN